VEPRKKVFCFGKRINTMGFDLRNNHGDYLPLSWSQWEHVLRTAADYGWRPRGTLPNRAMIALQLEGRDLSDDELAAEVERHAGRWNGSYLYTEYQIVEDADAEALADALERALASEPNSRFARRVAAFSAGSPCPPAGE
jgi:hypothetical protein